ncbi:protein phosphatase 2B regulatory subunit cnb-1-like [Haliotis asinina]|uniref:protein phosphatase 2B regulatory subunit cnb-1-like n=1 Tax=Haliotis asinina TaxID=109174 RepID=UPI0035325BAF
MIWLLVLAFACGALSAPTAVPDIAATFKQAFDSLDIDGSGNADLSEFLKAFDKFDTDGDGKITLAEYVAGTNGPKNVAEALFKNADADHDGFILRTDVKNVIPQFDTDGDGKVSFAEFVARYKQIFAAMRPNPPVGK